MDNCYLITKLGKVIYVLLNLYFFYYIYGTLYKYLAHILGYLLIFILMPLFIFMPLFVLLYNLLARLCGIGFDGLGSIINVTGCSTFLFIYYFDKILHAYFIWGFFF